MGATIAGSVVTSIGSSKRWTPPGAFSLVCRNQRTRVRFRRLTEPAETYALAWEDSTDRTYVRVVNPLIGADGQRHSISAEAGIRQEGPGTILDNAEGGSCLPVAEFAVRIRRDARQHKNGYAPRTRVTVDSLPRRAPLQKELRNRNTQPQGQSRCGLPEKKGGGLHRRLLLALLPCARHPAATEQDLLD